MVADFHLYSFGLFGLMQYATMSVKPQLIKVYKDFYLPLGENLKPCLKSFILALLPGLEEEGNEFFDDVRILLLSQINLRDSCIIMVICITII
jgi:hypothetical protein